MKIRIICPTPRCGKHLLADEKDLGKQRHCPHCEKDIILSRWSVGKVLFGDFEIKSALGAGGMGAVYLVRSRSGGQRFAVKTILPNKRNDKESRRAFLEEVQTWIDIPDHPHLAACRFFHTLGDEVAVFAEYVEGGTLYDWIHQGKLSQQEKILDVAIQFAWGLHAIHEWGLVHQDVKPGNVLMMRGGTAKVSDFGLARRDPGRSGTVATPPEQHSRELGRHDRGVLLSRTGGGAAADAPDRYLELGTFGAGNVHRRSDLAVRHGCC